MTDFVSYDDAVVIVDELRALRFPGLQPLRDCDADRLRSALAQPSATWDGRYLHRDFVRMAAILLYHVAKAHACLDGNKRIAVALMDAFIRLNGWRLSTTEDEAR